MITAKCPQCGGEFMQIETENTLDLICLGCRTDPPEARQHARIEPAPSSSRPTLEEEES